MTFEVMQVVVGDYLQRCAPYTTKHGKPLLAMQVKRILDRRNLYEGRYKYRDVEADGQHPTIIN